MNKKHMACAHWRPGDRCALGEDGVDDFCVLGPCSEEVPSHGDQLRNMSDEELAAFLADHPIVSTYDPANPTHREWLKWLQEVAEP